MGTWTCPCGRSMPTRHCPHCGAMVDADQPVMGDHRHPIPEKDISICVFCSGLSVFTESDLRLPTDEEWREAMAHEDTQQAIAVLSAMRRKGAIPDARDE